MAQLGLRTIVMYVFFVVLLIGGGWWALDISRESALQPRPADTPSTIRSWELNADQGEAVPPTRDMVDLEAEARRRAEFTEAASEVRRASEAVDALEGAVAESDARLNGLMENDAGRRVAANEASLSQFLTVLNQARPTIGDANRLRAKLATLRGPIDQASADGTTSYVPSAQLVGDIASLRHEVEQGLREYERHGRLVDAVIRGASANEPAAETLAGAIKTYQEKKATEEAARLAKIEEEATAAARAQTAQEFGAAVRQQVSEEDQHKLDEIERQRAEEARKAARKQLEAEFQRDLREIRSLLTPFISHGYTQPSDGGWFTKQSTKPGPVSLDALRGAGLLQDTHEALQMLHHAGTMNRDNDRPLGGFPPFITSSRDWGRYRPIVARAQELLRKYGDLMVDKKMLAK